MTKEAQLIEEISKRIKQYYDGLTADDECLAEIAWLLAEKTWVFDTIALAKEYNKE